MRPTFKKLLASAVAVALLIPTLPARASDALGHDLAIRETELAKTVQLADGTFWSDSRSDFRQENYIVYTPGGRVTPLVTYGEASRALTTALSAAAEQEALGMRVIAGINGDYYGVQHGIPLGSTMSGGVFRNANSDPYYAVGFRADGSALIGDPQLTIRATVNEGDTFGVYSFNHVRQSQYGVVLYDHNFNTRHTTGTSESGVDVLCLAESGALTIGGMLTLRVIDVLPNAIDTEVPEGMYVLTANHKASEATTAPLLALNPGDCIDITVTANAGSAWNDCVNLIGAPELLVKDGEVQSGLPADAAPRTAIGQRADGSLIFYTIDGRKAGYSIGATLTAVGMRLVELGCVTAVALDGGGSTTLLATMPNETAARVVNTPSDGSVRAVSNHVLLVAPNTPSGQMDHLYLAASATKAMPGAVIPLTAAAIDTNDLPMAASGAITYRTDKGSVSADGVFTAPDRTGTAKVTATCKGQSTTVEIKIMEPQSIVLKRNGTAITSLSILPDSEVTLTAEGIVDHLPLAGDNRCFTWKYEGDGAAIQPDGWTLRSGSVAGAGTLTVSLGSKRVSIPVTVGDVPLKLLNAFEVPFEPITDLVEPVEGSAGAEPAKPLLTLSYSTDTARVHNGKASARLDFTLDGQKAVLLPLRDTIPLNYSILSVWVYGDGSNTALTVMTDAGLAQAVSLAFQGWQQIFFALPTGAQTITGLAMAGGEAVSGSIWLDQLVLSYGKQDVSAPELTLSVEANTLTGRAFDAFNGASLPTLRLSYDGKALAYRFDERTGAISATLPNGDGKAHYVTLIAGDAAGHLARKSVYLPADETLAPAFPDLEGHWSNPSAEYLKRTGLSIGDDKGLYRPDANITRQEFATMLYRYLAPAQDFSEVALPFADADQIGAWALDAARAMYAVGIINGSKEASGALKYLPQANITRQEAATMLGRLLEKGYVASELSYGDASAVSDWASEQVSLLAASGVFDEFVTDAFDPLRPLTRGEMASMLLRIN